MIRIPHSSRSGTIIAAVALPLAFCAAASEPPTAIVPEQAAPGTSAIEEDVSRSGHAQPDTAPIAMEQTFSGRISAVNRDEQTITVDDARLGAQRLRIGEETKLRCGERAGSWDDLLVGRAVNGVVQGAPSGAHVEWLEVVR